MSIYYIFFGEKVDVRELFNHISRYLQTFLKRI